MIKYSDVAIKRPKIDLWVLSPHAVQRMAERRVTLSDISETIETPDFVIAQGPKWIFGKNFGNRSDNAVAIVLMERKERDLWVVVTIMVRFEKTR